MSDYGVAIMTGTGQGIGAGCARKMTNAGYKVSLMSPKSVGPVPSSLLLPQDISMVEVSCPAVG